MQNKFIQIIKYLTKSFWTLFKTGLIAIAPLLLTIAIFNLIVKSAASLLRPIRTMITSMTPYIPSWISSIPFIESLIVILILMLVGTGLNVLVFRSLLSKLEHWLDKIPFVRPIYSGMKNLVSSFGQQNRIQVQEVVLIKIKGGTYAIGFVTGKTPPELTPDASKEYENVFVPTTPNPTGGMFYVAATSELIRLNMTRKEAMTYIMSVGLIKSQSFKENQHNEIHPT